MKIGDYVRVMPDGDEFDNRIGRIVGDDRTLDWIVETDVGSCVAAPEYLELLSPLEVLALEG